MLKIEKTKDACNWYITLSGECIHGGFSSEREAVSHLMGYQKIWDSGYQAARDGFVFSKGDREEVIGSGSDYLDCLLGIGGFGKFGPINSNRGETE